MCEVIDIIEARGTMNALIATALNIIDSGKLSLEDIAEFTTLPLSKVQELAIGKTA